MATKSAPRSAAAASEMNASLGRQAKAAVAHLKAKGVNFLALDFDETILGVHTGGVWKHSLEELLPHVRPVFAHLIRTATETDGVFVAVVTFTPQIHLVRGVLAHVLGGDHDAASRIPIRGGDRSWEYKGVGSVKGKQPHMASAAEELLAGNMESGAEFTRSSTLLIDDDPRNIRAALKDQTRAIWFNPRADARELFESIKKIE